jgi:hypothetical protein
MTILALQLYIGGREMSKADGSSSAFAARFGGFSQRTGVD